jgi:NADPH-dependent curcumin reductase CurA
MHVVFMRLSIRGFIVTDFLAKAQETQQLFVKSVQEGKLKIGAEQEHVVDTKFDEVPKTWMQLFEGGNRGKLVTKIV